MGTFNALESAIPAAPNGIYDVTGMATACHEAGGAANLATKISVPEAVVRSWLRGEKVPADLCLKIDEAVPSVCCEHLRPDLHWLRDGAGEVLGYVTPVDGAGAAYVRQAIGRSSEDDNAREIALAMADGIMHPLAEDDREELRKTYRLRDPSVLITKSMLDDLEADVDDMTTDAVYFHGYGIMHGLADEQMDALREKYQLFATNKPNPGEFNELQAEADALRGVQKTSTKSNPLDWVAMRPRDENDGRVRTYDVQWTLDDKSRVRDCMETGEGLLGLAVRMLDNDAEDLTDSQESALKLMTMAKVLFGDAHNKLLWGAKA